MAKLHILDSTGDTEVTWTPENYAKAQKAFDKALAKGYSAFDNSSTPAKRLKEFDQNAQDVVMVPHIVGG